MTKFILTIDCGNAAFDPDPAPEIAHILRTLAQSLDDHGVTRLSTLYDYNGNKVGTAKLEQS